VVRSPHFVDNERFAGTAGSLRGQREAIRAELGLRPGSTVALFAGKLIHKKRPLDFIRAVAVAGAQGSGVQALMVGDGELRAECEKVAQELEVDAVFAGFLNQSQIPRAYAAADVLVLPSDYGETWGLVVNEAMACSLPAIVSDACGCAPDMIVEGETGFTFPLGDVEQMSNRLRELARPGEPVRMGTLAGRHVMRFNARAAASGILEAAGSPA
jgi:glycosyltransferase involved in cell wall biosynthesis